MGHHPGRSGCRIYVGVLGEAETGSDRRNRINGVRVKTRLRRIQVIQEPGRFYSDPNHHKNLGVFTLTPIITTPIITKIQSRASLNILTATGVMSYRGPPLATAAI